MEDLHIVAVAHTGRDHLIPIRREFQLPDAAVQRAQNIPDQGHHGWVDAGIRVDPVGMVGVVHQHMGKHPVPLTTRMCDRRELLAHLILADLDHLNNIAMTAVQIHIHNGRMQSSVGSLSGPRCEQIVAGGVRGKGHR